VLTCPVAVAVDVEDNTGVQQPIEHGAATMAASKIFPHEPTFKLVVKQMLFANDHVIARPPFPDNLT
jgi:hypothetical protein